MKKVSNLRKIRFLRVLGIVVLIASLFWLAMNFSGYSQGSESSLFRKVPLPKKLKEVLGAVESPVSEQKETPEESETPKPEVLSFSKIKEKAQEKVIESSKEIVREKVVEVLKELIDKLAEEETTKEKVCSQVCEEACKEASNVK